MYVVNTAIYVVPHPHPPHTRFPHQVMPDTTIIDHSHTVFSSTSPLPLITVVVLTDVHSWVAGHARHSDTATADYGAVLSFYQHCQNLAATTQSTHALRDVLLVNNGDFLDGTGLSTVPPLHLLPILNRMPWDAFNLGNHELYHDESVAFLQRNGAFNTMGSKVGNGGNYLTSNTYWNSSDRDHTAMKENDDENERVQNWLDDVADRYQRTKRNVTQLRPLGRRYTILHAPHVNAHVLTFGFLYNFTNYCSSTYVQPVQEAIREKWFRRALLDESYDAILVLAHMDYQDQLVTVLHRAIRNILNETTAAPQTPIQFINGHSHRRGYAVLDPLATAMEAGRFLDTVGVVTFPTTRAAHNRTHEHGDVADLFGHVFLDANRKALREAVGIKNDVDFDTPAGQALSVLINSTRAALGLDDVLGCAPEKYFLPEWDTPASLWRLYTEHVVPATLTHDNASRVFVQSTGAWRMDLFAGTVTRDDLVAVSPYNDTIYAVARNVDGRALRKALKGFQTIPDNATLPPWAVASAHSIHKHGSYDLWAPRFDIPRLHAHLHQVWPHWNTTTPIQLFNISNPNQALTTTALWVEFVSTHWTCLRNTPVGDRSTHWLLALAIVGMVVLGSGVLLQERLRFVSKDTSDAQALVRDGADAVTSSHGKYGSLDDDEAA